MGHRSHEVDVAEGKIAVLALAALLSLSGNEARSEPLPVAPAARHNLAQPAAVFGSDDRALLPPRLRELEGSVGLLYERGTRSVCTAFCVDDAVIATAGHCLFRTSDQRPPSLRGFVFTLRQAKPVATSIISGSATGGGQQFVMAGSMRISTRPPIDASRDWALIKLAKPVCAGKSLRLTRRSPEELSQLARSNRVYQVAFHRDFANWKLAYGPSCEIKREFGQASWGNIARDFTDANHLVLHSCDTGAASSGSPLLVQGPRGPEVVGINVGTYVQSRVLMQNGEVIKRFKADTIANTGVSSSAFAAKLDVFQRADIIARRDDVKQLQQLLAARGLYAGKPDGLYGAQLREAIEHFEKSENRPVTGLATTALLQRLGVVAANAAKPTTIEVRGEGTTSRGQKSRGQQ